MFQGSGVQMTPRLLAKTVLYGTHVCISTQSSVIQLIEDFVPSLQTPAFFLDVNDQLEIACYRHITSLYHYVSAARVSTST